MDNGWVDADIADENQGFNAIGHILYGKEIKKVIIALEQLYGALLGEYRIFKEAFYKTSSDEYDAYSLYESFTIGGEIDKSQVLLSWTPLSCLSTRIHIFSVIERIFSKKMAIVQR